MIVRDTLWTADESPYIISGNILIRENVRLEIEPGVTVQFKTPAVSSVGYHIRVSGVLKAEGTEDQPILFTAEDPASPWGCIAFADTGSDWDETSSTGCILKHCIIEYAGNKQESGDAEFGGAAVISSSASPLIANNTIRYSTGGGIRVSGGVQRILSNLIHETGYGIFISSDGALLENNYIINTGQGIYLGPNTDKTEIKNNTIINNLSTADGACLSINLFHHEPPTEIVVSGNHIVNNTGNAVAISAEAPDANDKLRFFSNNIENPGGNLSVHLSNWQRVDSEPVGMALNWWGTTDVDEIDRMIYDAGNDFYLPPVNYQPVAVKEILNAGSDIDYSPPVEGDDDDDDNDDDDDDVVIVEPEDDPRGITEDTIWKRSESPYIITGNILVNENIRLEIEPGVVVKFSTPPVASVGYYIRVDGILKAQGDENNPILFTAEDPLNHRWGCIAFTDTSTGWDETTLTGSVIRNCAIEYAGNSQEGGAEEFGGAAIRCSSASPLIAENLIRYSAGHGILAVGGDQRILSNRIHDTGAGIIISPESALIENNYLINNAQGIYVNSGNNRIEIRNNSFLNIESEESEENRVVGSSDSTDGTCMSINLYRHEEVSDMAIYENHILSSAGNAVAISAPDPEPNVVLRMNRNNIENTGGNLLVYLHDWQVKNPTPLYMTQNWWGTEDADEIDEMMYDVKNDFHLPKLIFQPIITEEISGAWSDLSYPPLASAGSDQTVNGDVTVTLDGSYSFDPDNILSYHWTQTDGSSVSLSDAAVVKPTFVSPSVSGDDATLTFQLTVEDAYGFRNSDEVKIMIDESTSVKMERDKGQCFIETAADDSAGIGFLFPMVILFLFLYQKLRRI
ncbi:right-handed parallel beta-helix repeat-containing protein [Desulfobacterales bacterium HSG2]|nr:right-handed parallel beta-helix repeat-containing protein [Desulfobacterales bacterium HSG2]